VPGGERLALRAEPSPGIVRHAPQR
jgi:hypothetical protein